MNKPILLSCVLPLLALNAFGQSAAATNRCSLFALPHIVLRSTNVSAGSEKGSPSQEVTEVVQPHTPHAQMEPMLYTVANPTFTIGDGALNAREAELERRLYQRLERDGCLTRAPIKPDGFLQWCDDAIASTFAPEVFHIGKAECMFSPVTAIKRRNPLCLLNPVVLNVAW